MDLKQLIVTSIVLNINDEESTISPKQLVSKPASNDQFIVSDADEEILILIKFSKVVRLRNIKIHATSQQANETRSPPKLIHVYKTKHLNLNFDDVQMMKPDRKVSCKPKKLDIGQTINLHNNSKNAVKFSKVEYLAVYILSNQNDTEQTYLSGITFYDESDKTDETKSDPSPANTSVGILILNAALIIIPDEVITTDKYLETIDGITYVLYYNNCGLSTGECRLEYSFIEFWNKFVNDETPTFDQISADIEHNEGPTYDYLMEHPPNDLILHGILPVLVKVVNELK
eukprot:432755_1